MGRGDSRNSPKMKRLKSQRKKKGRAVQARETGLAAKAQKAAAAPPPPAASTPPAKPSKSR